MIHHPTQTSGHDSSAIRQAGFVISVMLLAIWQVALFQYTLKWDAMDITLPWRYFVADAIYQNGTMPWWNPFQH
ncbi:MAG: hypothetical protein KDC53_17510, partial [Saprospiraceae bacterium]|nr:hypothetical protein [Saprospiraceae bacterium]